MKFGLLVLLACLAVNVSAFQVRSNPQNFDAIPEGRGVIVDKVKEFVDAIIEKATDAITKVLEKAKTLVAKLLEQIQTIVDVATAALDAIAKNIEAKLSEIVQQGKVAKACVDEHRPKIASTITDAKQNVYKCATNARDRAHSILDSFIAYSQDIKNNLKDLNQIVFDCVKILKPISSLRCVIDKSENIRESIDAIIDNAKQSLVDANDIAATIVGETSACALGTVLNAQSQIKKVQENIIQCIETERN